MVDAEMPHPCTNARACLICLGVCVGLALKTLVNCPDAPEGLYLPDILGGRGGVGVVDGRLGLVYCVK